MPEIDHTANLVPGHTVYQTILCSIVYLSIGRREVSTPRQSYPRIIIMAPFASVQADDFRTVVASLTSRQSLIWRHENYEAYYLPI